MTGRWQLERRSAVIVAVAGGVWAGGVGGRWWGPSAVAVTVAVGTVTSLLWRHRLVPVVAVLVAAGAWSGLQSAARESTILAFESSSGRIELVVRLVTDPRREDHGWWALAVADPPESGRPPAIPMLLSFSQPTAAVAGERWQVEGRRTARAGRARGDPYSGVVTVGSARTVTTRPAPWWEVGNAVRRRTLRSLAEGGTGRALLAGFLVGETAGVPPADIEAMRRTGLSHLVAVSGSNVALFLMLTVTVAGPLASGPRRRAAFGLTALVVLVIATRWEPSVIRASVMAAIMLGGRIGGWALDTASALAVTVIGVVVVSGEMATDVGFALSVLATIGVLVGSRSLPGAVPRPLAGALGATAGAQLAVAPLILTVFGAIPLMAPLTNLVAAPVVALATAVGAVGVASGSDLLINAAAAGASFVLAVARTGAGWPQLGWVGFGSAVGVLILVRYRPTRPFAVGVGAVAVAAALVGTTGLARPGAVILDVGQGDSILVVAGDGSTMLVDGGPDPAVLEAKLADYGIRALDLLVLTHVHADHATGLAAVLGRRPVAEMWVPGPPHSTPASVRILALAEAAGVPTREAPVGTRVALGDLIVEVLGPMRRYASPNDQSIVLRVGTGGGPRLLLTGDIETYAQANLSGLTSEILKVPHQGGATSDLGWLAGVGADLAVISVGPNDFGHPSNDVISALQAAGSIVKRTDLDGDVVVALR